MAKTGYRARRLISVAEGAMYGPGDQIDGPFNPKDPHNAQLIETDAVQVLPGSPKRRKKADGGDAPSPSVEGVSEDTE